MHPAASPQKPFLINGSDRIEATLARRAVLVERMAKDLFDHSVWQEEGEAIQLLRALGYHLMDICILINEVRHEAMLMAMMDAVGEAMR